MEIHTHIDIQKNIPKSENIRNQNNNNIISINTKDINLEDRRNISDTKNKKK